MEDPFLYTKRANISELLSIQVAISYATIDKDRVEEENIEKMKMDITSLRNKVSYYKGSPDIIIKFVEDIMEENMKHEKIGVSFISKIAELQEETLKLSIVHKEIRKWNENQDKLQEKISYIK